MNNSLPIDLDIETGASESELDLRSLDLTNLQVQTGAGTTQIDLSSVLDHDLQADVEGGVGELSVILPGEMGVRVALDQGIGGLTNSGLVKDGDYYVNEAYDVSPNTLFLNISAGIGAVELVAP
jgi:predicted membrane protein